MMRLLFLLLIFHWNTRRDLLSKILISRFLKPTKTVVMTNTFDYNEAFSRNEGLISKEEQERLRSSRIAIPGLGGVGGVHLMTLARMGIERFHIADADQFSLANFNRQYGASVSNLGKNKTEV